jgi:histidinol-phosphate aminotransferase
MSHSSRFWSPGVLRLRPYVAGEQPQLSGILKLNTNESPYGPAPQVIAAIRAAASDELRRYPDPRAGELREVLARYHGLPADLVFAGNGSDEVLGFAFAALLNHDAPVLFPDVTYGFYPAYCALFGIQYRAVPVTDSLEVDPTHYGPPCGGIVLANPNAPTGIALAPAAVAGLAKRHPDRVVLVDEAYVDFGADSCVPLIAQHDNVLVVRTFSKSRSLAGLRVGYALGSRELIEALERVKDSFNSYPLDRLALAGARAAIEAEEHFQNCRGRIIATREHLTERLRWLGFRVLPSKANFLFTSHPRVAARRLAGALRDRGIFVRHFDLPRIDNFLRISIGTAPDTERLLAALNELVAAGTSSC